MKMPDHLWWFPCMQPWIGRKYDERRLTVVGESHYLPPDVTCKNYCPSTWYSIRQEDVPNINCAHSYMDTQKCVRQRHTSGNRTYKTIEEVVSFEEIAFFNYVFRPAEEKKKGYSQTSCFDILDDDRAVSSEIMEWFIQEHQPTAIVIASAIVMKYTCVRYDLAAHPEIATCMTDHPQSPRKRFQKDVKRFLENGYQGSNACLPLCLKECEKARCHSYRWRRRPS